MPSGLAFASPALLLLLPLALVPLVPLVPAVLAALGLRSARGSARRRPALAVADAGLALVAAGDAPTRRVRWRALPDVMRVAAVIAVVLALARPQQGLALTTLPEDGIDIVIALDASSSMSELPSVSASRLAAARFVVDQFVSGLEGDRVGLVIFQSRALALSPLTLDRVALRRAVQAVRSGLLPDGTAIGLGLAEALNLLRDSPARSRVVVLLTDGQNNAGEVDPLEAARIAQALGVRVYTIGFLPASGGIRGVVDEATLRQIASMTDAAYYNASTRDELAEAYRTISSLERSRVGERRFASLREFAPWLAAAALTLLIAEAVLRSTVLRRYP